MKTKIFFFLAAIVFSYSAFPQNVGIGTNAPSGRLHIDLTGTANTNAIIIEDDGDPLIQFSRLGASKGFVQSTGDDIKLGTYATNNLGKLIFRINGTDRMFFTPAGNIGIGITDPVGRFQVAVGNDAGVTTHGYLMLGSVTGENVVFDNNEILARNNGVVSTLFLARDGSKVQLGNGAEASGTKLHITTGNDVGLSDNLSGFLMMGSQSGTNIVLDNNEIQARNNNSASTLYLQHAGGATRFGNTIGAHIEVAGITIRALNNNTSETLILQPDGLTRIGSNSDLATTKLHISEGVDAGMAGNQSGYMMIGLSNSENVVLDNNEIMSRNNGASGTLFIQHDQGNVLLCGNEQGAVGIGILSSSSIPIGYMLAVDGRIIAEELKVQMSGSWPDYVFAENYKLRPLAELKNFIKQNKHLPGIPPAAEVEKNGVEVGDMQKKMMEKIEELTLYVLQLEEEIMKLRKQK